MNQLYFIAIMPPAEIRDRITQLKKEFSEKYSSKQALKSPPHITLHMPFRWKDKKVDQLHTFVKNINKRLEPFEVALKGFDFFEPRVVFVNVLPNDALRRLQSEIVQQARKELLLDNANYKDRPFHPHMTIAFRDLKKPMFYAAQAHYSEKEINHVFWVEKIELLKHDGERWQAMEG